MRFKHDKQTGSHSKWKWFGVITFLINVVGAVFLLLHPGRLTRYLRGQKRELGELQTGDEDVSRFLKDSGRLFKDCFIPHDGNGHRPKALRPRSLATYAAIALVTKAAVTGFLFLTYPSPASLSAIMAERMIELINQARVEAN